MQNKDINDFIYFMTHNKSLTRQQQAKRDRLLARDCVKIEDKQESSGIEGPRSGEFRPLDALATAQFLSLFNDPMGLKYLTHDFDPNEDGRPQTMSALVKQATEVFANAKDLPRSLWALINAYVNGTSEWSDTYGVRHNANLSSKEWKAWSEQNHLHPINNPEFAEEIGTFRSTVRLVSPLLQDMVGRLGKECSLHITTTKLDKADFYTNTYILYKMLGRILKMMNGRANLFPEVSIVYQRQSDSEGRMFRRIVISQKGSYGDKPIEEVMRRLEQDAEAGDLGAIRNNLNGYCQWQVETKWDGVPYRWNILRDSASTEIEKIPEEEITGFTHILTFYFV